MQTRSNVEFCRRSQCFFTIVRMTPVENSPPSSQSCPLVEEKSQDKSLSSRLRAKFRNNPSLGLVSGFMKRGEAKFAAVQHRKNGHNFFRILRVYCRDGYIVCLSVDKRVGFYCSLHSPQVLLLPPENPRTPNQRARRSPLKCS